MNEAAKAAIKGDIEKLGDGITLDFDAGTELGRKAAEAAVVKYLFDSPEDVTPRPGIGTGR